MFKYLNRKDLTVVESPYRLDLRLKEHRHLMAAKGPTFPAQKDGGFSIAQIAAEWGVTYKYVLKNRTKLLPPPDGKCGGMLVWNRIPKFWRETKVQGFTTKDVAKHYGLAESTISNYVHSGKIRRPDLVIKGRVGSRWFAIPELQTRRKLPDIVIEI